MDIYLSIAKAINDEIDDAFYENVPYTEFGRYTLRRRIHAIVERNLTANAPDTQEAKATEDADD